MVASTFAVAGAQGAKPKADDVGISDTEIRVAVISDVDTPIQPGLFQKSVDAMEAWAKVVNKEGGIAGRKVVIDFIDSKLNPNETRNAIIKACADDFAMVGGQALFLSNVTDMVACTNKAGEAIGIPDMPGNALDNAQACSPVTYVLNGRGSYCETKDDNPQTYTTLQGDYLYYLKKNESIVIPEGGEVAGDGAAGQALSVESVQIELKVLGSERFGQLPEPAKMTKVPQIQ